MAISCCRYCTERKPACHDSCKRYKDQLAEYRAERFDLQNRYKSCRSTRTIQLSNKRGTRNGY